MRFPKFKKDISLFLSSEEAKVLKKDIAKWGLTASAIAAIMASTVDADAASHNDSHNDSTTHADHTSHTDGLKHTDAHSSHSSHGDSHSNDSTGTHNSTAAVYDEANRRGGHESSLGHASSHTDN